MHDVKATFPLLLSTNKHWCLSVPQKCWALFVVMTEQLRVLRHERKKLKKTKNTREWESDLTKMEAEEEEEEATANLGPWNLTRTWVVVVVVVGILVFLALCTSIYPNFFFFTKQPFWGEDVLCTISFLCFCHLKMDGMGWEGYGIWVKKKKELLLSILSHVSLSLLYYVLEKKSIWYLICLLLYLPRSRYNLWCIIFFGWFL